MKKIAVMMFAVSAALAGCHHSKPAAKPAGGDMGSGSAAGSAAGSGDMGGSGAGSAMPAPAAGG